MTINLAGTFINNGTGTTTITDADTGAVVGGIALTGITGSGTWAYSLDGTTFTSSARSPTTSALLLPNTAALRYTPDGTDSETATITYWAWDTTTGTAGGTADTTTNGGTTAFSTATDTASLTVASGEHLRLRLHRRRQRRPAHHAQRQRIWACRASSSSSSSRTAAAIGPR